MKQLFNVILEKVFKKVINRSVSKEVALPELESAAVAVGDSKMAFWKFVIQTLISILTAVLTTLGTTSCMGVH